MTSVFTLLCVFRWSCGVCVIPRRSSPTGRSWACSRVRGSWSWSSSTPPPPICWLSEVPSWLWSGTPVARARPSQVAAEEDTVAPFCYFNVPTCSYVAFWVRQLSLLFSWWSVLSLMCNVSSCGEGKCLVFFLFHWGLSDWRCLRFTALRLSLLEQQR